MKKLILSALASTAMLSTSVAADESGLYLGLGYAKTNIDLNIDNVFDNDTYVDEATDSIVLQLGYDFNEYVGVEGRYYVNNSSIAFDYYLGGTPLEGTYKAETFALYVKPQYNLDIITVYGLFGMAANDYTAMNLLNADNETLFSWGAGAKLNVTDSFGIFVDYTDLGDSDNIASTGLTSWNLGISYKF